MKGRYESVVLLHAEEARRAIAIMRERGEHATLEHMMASYEPEESTLVDSRMPPWNEDDVLYEDDDCVLYYNLEVPYIGLVRRVTTSSAA